MEKTCTYCGGLLSGSETSCPHCGAPTADRSDKSRKPQTIEELISFSQAHNLPLEKMRFFLGQDYPSPKAFGIFRDADGSFVVYKNKADGTRAIRYRGPDEAHAVNEIYLKMKEEISKQRSYQAAKRGGFRSASQSRFGGGQSGKPMAKILKWIFVIVIVVILFAVSFGRGKNRNGYYRYRNGYYYNQNDSWYYYQGSEWIPMIVDSELDENYEDYYTSDDYDNSYGVQDFADSDYYSPGSYDRDDNDWNDDWDDDDWDWDDGDDWDDIGDWDDDW